MRRLVLFLSFLLLAAPVAAQQLVHIKGKAFIAPDGRPLSIKGISLGNWLIPEGYIFKFEVAIAAPIFAAFDRLLGAERAARSGPSSAIPTSRATTSASSSRSASIPCASRCTTACS